MSRDRHYAARLTAASSNSCTRVWYGLRCRAANCRRSARRRGSRRIAMRCFALWVLGRPTRRACINAAIGHMPCVLCVSDLGDVGSKVTLNEYPIAIQSRDTRKLSCRNAANHLGDTGEEVDRYLLVGTSDIAGQPLSWSLMDYWRRKQSVLEPTSPLFCIRHQPDSGLCAGCWS